VTSTNYQQNDSEVKAFQTSAWYNIHHTSTYKTACACYQYCCTACSGIEQQQHRPINILLLGWRPYGCLPLYGLYGLAMHWSLWWLMTNEWVNKESRAHVCMYVCGQLPPKSKYVQLPLEQFIDSLKRRPVVKGLSYRRDGASLLDQSRSRHSRKPHPRRKLCGFLWCGSLMWRTDGQTDGIAIAIAAFNTPNRAPKRALLLKCTKSASCTHLR